MILEFLNVSIGILKLFFCFISFCKKSIEDVKNFLVQYCDERKQAGFFMLPDPLSFFYEALCVGLDRHDNLTVDDYNTQPPMANLGWFACLQNFCEVFFVTECSFNLHVHFFFRIFSEKKYL